MMYSSAFVNALIPLFGAVLVKALVNAISTGDTSGVSRYALLLGLVSPIPFVIKRFQSRESFVLIEKSVEQYDREIIRLSSEIPVLTHLEDPEYLNRLEQLRFQPAALGMQGTQISVYVWGLAWAVLLVGLLVSVDPWLVIMPVTAIPGVLMVRRFQDQWQRDFERGAASRRVAVHCFDLATNPTHADEVRTLRIGHELIRRHHESWHDAERAVAHTERWGSLRLTLGRLLFVIGYIGAVALVVVRGIDGEATAGDLALTVVLAGVISQQLASVVDCLGRAQNALAMVDRYLWLVDYAAAHPPTPDPAPVPSRIAHGMDLHHVDFRYPGTGTDVFTDLNLWLPAGSVVALVGDNGVGKTTLVKLLTRLYEPTAGTILVDGTPLERFDVADWRQHTAGAFQDYARFETTVHQAVGIGDVQHLDDTDLVRDALERAGSAELPSALERGLDTEVGASFENGTQLSGGQWQKLALARAMMDPAPLLLVLDEPTANLDPDAEAALFARYASPARRAAAEHGTITVLVSHRFSTVRIADLIVVLDGSGVRETGSHAELMANDDLYAELYELQAVHYR
jgi:ATP-binding cassette subfamily B protein